MTLTVEDLARTLEDDRHGGFGYACCVRYIESAKNRERLARAIVFVANEIGLDYEGLFSWSNSKHGRWLADEVEGRESAATRATVRGHLSEAIVLELAHLEGRYQ